MHQDPLIHFYSTRYYHTRTSPVSDSQLEPQLLFHLIPSTYLETGKEDTRRRANCRRNVSVRICLAQLSPRNPISSPLVSPPTRVHAEQPPGDKYARDASSAFDAGKNCGNSAGVDRRYVSASQNAVKQRIDAPSRIFQRSSR